MSPRRFWAPRAWLGGGWAESVLLSANEQGRWASIQPGTVAPAEAEVLAGPADRARLPAQGVRPRAGQLAWLLDAAAASQLP